MKLIQAILYGFGKFYQKTISFQDGIHVIYGPNEAGKSTLHTFLGCMLFGLERGRGRAARGDLYSRYLPWDHDATYGGALTLETEEQTYHIQRSFRSDRRTCLLATDDQSPLPCSDDTLTDRCLEGLTESLYYNTISVRSIGSAPDTSLAQELTRQLTDLHQTGNDTIHYHSAISWLRVQRKQQEALLTPDLEQQILTKQHALEQLELHLQNTSFQERKAALQMDMEDCLEQLAAIPSAETAPSFKANDQPPFDRASRSGRGSHPHRFSFSLFATLLLFALTAATAWLWTQQRTTEALAVGAAALVILLLQAFRPRHHRGPHEDNWQDDIDDPYEDDDSAQNNSTEGDNDEENDSLHGPSDPRIQRLRRRMETLQQQYEAVCRQEWDHDHLLEQAQTLEDELEQLILRQTQEEDIRLEIQAIALATSTLQKLSDQMQNDIGPRLAREMSRILAGLTDGIYTKVFVDGQLHVSVQAGADTTSPTDMAPFSDRSAIRNFSGCRTIPLESLSRGTMEQVYLAMRLAVIELLFPQGGMPLILDDCFLTYDDDRLAATLSWLAEHYSGQILIFTCQKREAALLHKEQIPFTHIVL